MPIYKAPVRDISFALREVFNYGTIRSLPPFTEVTDDLIDAVFIEGAKFAENELFPLNEVGDREGCTIKDGKVKTPTGFKEAYHKFVEGGWTSLSCTPEYGGQGLPDSIDFMLQEIICSANMSFGLYPGLTKGAYTALLAHGSDEIKQRYLPKLIDGTWSGTMNLTEPQCGTDLGLIKTKAVPQEDGSFVITGNKIWISSGEHDFTDNIIHLVLARTPTAPEGVKGISLFVVPKFLVKDDGSLGERNKLICTALEHKMGINGSATCAMSFDGAKGWLVGVENEGLSHMFTMMNNERIGVGLQGLGLAEVAYQNAVAYAKDRLQSRSLAGAKYPEKPADPIIVHPDIRRMLMTQKAYNEGCRMLSAWIGINVDISHHHSEKEERQHADDFVQLMTPIVKAFFTDMAWENVSHALQIHGGYGYTKDFPMEQYLRDTRISMIYEGTNGIQALDLVGRKLGMNVGRPLRAFFHPVSEFIEEHKDNKELEEFIEPLAKAFGRLQRACVTIAQKGIAKPEEAGAAAVDFLSLFAHTTLAYLWAKAVIVAQAKLKGSDKAFYNAKIETARFYMQKLLPRTSALFAQIMAGKETLMSLDDDAFGVMDFAGFSEEMSRAS